MRACALQNIIEQIQQIKKKLKAVFKIMFPECSSQSGMRGNES